MMNKVTKVAAVAVMVGGTAFGGTVAHADNPSAIGSFCTVTGDGTSAPAGVIGTPHATKCNQDFDGGTAFVAPSPGI